MENKTETQALEENIERKSRKNIKVGAILGYVGFAINILYGLFFTPWILEVVGDSSYGVYTVAMSVINLFLLDFGLSTTTNAYLAKYRATHDEASANRYCGVVLKTYLILDAILAAVFLTLFFTLEFIYQGLTPEEVTSLKGVFLIVALFSLVSFPSAIFKGVLESHEEFAFLKAVTIGEKLLTTALSAGALLLGFGIYGVVGSHAICGTVSVILYIIFVRKKTPIRLNFKEKMDWTFLKPIFSF
ncbi:MAG: oligosaccharide flippase family protein, partial [Bacillales bacterium]|nr:oligosaccharide flippase family protein [Bacillales bacterium]MDY5920424.1 oligosaccharide flippase family protein [Candidatus Enteromonas sp.]